MHPDQERAAVAKRWNAAGHSERFAWLLAATMADTRMQGAVYKSVRTYGHLSTFTWRQLDKGIRDGLCRYYTKEDATT